MNSMIDVVGAFLTGLFFYALLLGFTLSLKQPGQATPEVWILILPSWLFGGMAWYMLRDVF